MNSPPPSAEASTNPADTAARQGWRVSGQFQTFLLVRGGELAEDEASDRVPAVLIVSELDRWLSSVITRRICHELYEAVTGVALDGLLLHQRVDPSEVRRRLAEAFFEQELVALPLSPPRIRKPAEAGAVRQSGSAPMPVPLLADAPGAAQEGAGAANQSAGADQDQANEEAQSETVWVGIELVDDSGKPMAGVRYRLKLADGSIQEGTLDDNGAARVEGIAEGQCEISFPDLDADSWSPQ